MNISKPFINSMEQLLGSECSSFMDALQHNPKTSVRLNPLKPENELKLAAKIPWCEYGYYIEERPVFTLDPFFHAGHYYVQEASSMFIDYILKYLEVPKDISVLDLCSAPGGKSTLLASYFSEAAFLHCHEFDQHRTAALQHNIIKWGRSNITITQGSLKDLFKTGITYDLILLDAPCSGEGMFRKESKALSQWSAEKIYNCVHLQNEILHIASQLGKENSLLIYSTCTYNQMENEGILEPLVSNGTYESVEIRSDLNIRNFNSNSNLFTYRFFPHRMEGEGLTLSVLRKRKEPNLRHESKSPHYLVCKRPDGPWLQNPDEYTLLEYKKNMFAIRSHQTHFTSLCFHHLNVWSSGIPFGQLKGKDFIPAHGLSQSVYKSDYLTKVQFELKSAREFLKCASIPAIDTKGVQWQIAQYHTASLGWMKLNPNGWKNYYPKNYRIQTL